MTNADARTERAAVPAVGATNKRILGRNSDTETNASPFAATETRTALRVKRSGDTDTATGTPFCELWAGTDRIAHFASGATSAVGVMATIQKSMYKPWGAMAHGEAIDLHPGIVITFPRGAMGRSDVSVSVRQAAFKDNIERDSDKRKRALWACECLAATLHVGDWTMIARQHITGAAEINLDAALAAIRARAKVEDATNVIPNVDGALAEDVKYKGRVTAMDTTKEMKEKLDETFPRDGKPVDETPKHFSTDGAWRMAVADERKKYRVSAALTSDEFSEWLHKIFDVKSLKELSMTPQAALGIIADTLKAEFGTKPTPAETRAVDAASAPVAEVAAMVTPATPNGATAARTEPQGGAITEQPRHAETFIAEKKTIRKENTIKVSGQDYLKAQGRVTLWKHDHPDWSMETEAVSIAPDFAVFKACIKDGSGKTVSTGHGFCTPDLAKKVSGRFVEKAETAAVSRALAFAGYGTDDTLDDADYIADSPRAA